MAGTKLPNDDMHRRTNLHAYDARKRKKAGVLGLASCVVGPRCGLACCMKCMHKGWALYVEEESLPGFGKACLGLLLVSRWPYSWVGNGLHLRHKLGPNKS